MKEQIMKFLSIIAYNASIYCVTLTAPSVEMAKMTTPISGAHYRLNLRLSMARNHMFIMFC